MSRDGTVATLSQFVDLEQLGVVREFVVGVARDLGLAQDDVYGLQLAVDEACTNVVRHAYGGLGGQVEVEVAVDGDRIQIVIRDWGAAFDPEAVPAPDITAPLEQRPLGGLGLFLMREMMDEIHFSFDADQGNTLTMVKHLQEMK